MARRATYISRHGSHSRQKKRLIALALLAVAGCVALGLLLEPNRVLAAQDGRAEVSPTVQIAPNTSAPIAATVARRVYPYSIVPGGVYGRDELLRVLKTDKVVAAHYVSFDAEKAVKVTVTKPRAVYVSYRKGDKVYWTAKKLMLADGETLLSDGRTEMRARCANRISDVPQLPVEHDEPTEEELDTAVNIAMDPDEFAGAQFAFNRINAGTGLAGSETASGGHTGRASMASIAGKRITPVSVQTGDSPSGSTGGTPAVVVPPETEIEDTDNPFGPSAPGSKPSTPLPEVRPPAPGNPTKPGPDGTPSFPDAPPDDVPPPIAEPDTGGPGTPQPPPLTPEPPWTPPGQPIDTGEPVEDVHEVPEPNSLWLCGAGFAVMLLRRNRARPKR